MGWKTIYITGKSGCGAEVLRSLEHSGIDFMPGALEGERGVGLYWVDDKVSLKAFKKAIGAKLVLKYRLHFFNSLEGLHSFAKNPESFTDQENNMIRKMTEWETLQHYKHSA